MAHHNETRRNDTHIVTTKMTTLRQSEERLECHVVVIVSAVMLNVVAPFLEQEEKFDG
jgi:hypothetical protein